MLSQLLRHSFFCLLFVALVRTESTAQHYPEIPEQTLDDVFEQYAGTLENATRVHQIGFQAQMICDYDSDEREEPTPRNYRRYGIVADVGNGKFRRIENVGWSIKEDGISWEQGARLIRNDVGSFFQHDPTSIKRVDNPTPNIMIHTQSIYSPFGLIWTTIVGATKGLATPTAMASLETEAKLIGVTFKDSKVECLYLANNHLNALSVVFDKSVGGMPVETRALWRNKKFVGTDKLKPLEKIDPREISQWLVLSKAKVSWQRVSDSKKIEYWVPAIVDIKEQDPGTLDRMAYYFVDWKIDKDVDRAIFDHKRFEKKKPGTIYAELEIAQEYQARQTELDDKVIALKKKFKLE